MPGPSNESCGKCYYFEKDKANLAGKAGICFRRPPRFMQVVKQPNPMAPPQMMEGSFFPTTDSERWCGDFRAKEGTQFLNKRLS